jgi:hypothetical protein
MVGLIIGFFVVFAVLLLSWYATDHPGRKQVGRGPTSSGNTW